VTPTRSTTPDPTPLLAATARPGPTREFIAIVTACMAMAAVSIDLMLPAFDEIRAEFGLARDSSKTSLLVTSFFLGLGLGQLVYGPLSDRFGRKPLLWTGLAIMAASAAGAALAPSLGSIIVCRFVWGLGAAAPRSLALAIVRDTTEGARMARLMSLIMAVFIVVPVFAPALGAVFMGFLPWRIVFWVPCAAAIGLAVWITRMPETLALDRRRAVGPAALGEAFRVVVRTRQTVAYGLAVMFMFGFMSSYLASSEIIIEDVFEHGDEFPVIFGALALVLGLASLLNARLVMRVGVVTVVRGASLWMVAATTTFAAIAFVTDGTPPLWVYCAMVALILPAVSLIGPNCNTLSMAPVPHVAGMASAVIGTAGTAGGALLGSIVDASFDNTVRPFVFGSMIFSVAIVACIHLLGRRPQPAPAASATSAIGMISTASPAAGSSPTAPTTMTTALAATAPGAAATTPVRH
jgi:MFS transporter, DHA1 family, multidrug resistance protein